MTNRLLLWWKALLYHRHYIIADPRDNSITFSRRLYRHISRSASAGEAKVFAFFIPESGCYGFSVNPPLSPEDTQIADIQYNDKYRSIGFESLCPSVNRIFYDYGLPSGSMLRLSVIPRRAADGSLFYQIMRPRHVNP